MRVPTRECWAWPLLREVQEAARGCRDEHRDSRQLERFRDPSSILRAQEFVSILAVTLEGEELTRECRMRLQIEELSEFVERTSRPIVSSGSDSEHLDDLHDSRRSSSLERTRNVVRRFREDLAQIAVLVHSSRRISREAGNRSSRGSVAAVCSCDPLHDGLEILGSVFMRFLVRDIFLERRNHPRFVLLRNRRVPVENAEPSVKLATAKGGESAGESDVDPRAEIASECRRGEENAPSIQAVELDRDSVPSSTRNRSDHFRNMSGGNEGERRIGEIEIEDRLDVVVEDDVAAINRISKVQPGKDTRSNTRKEAAIDESSGLEQLLVLDLQLVLVEIGQVLVLPGLVDGEDLQSDKVVVSRKDDEQSDDRRRHHKE